MSRRDLDRGSLDPKIANYLFWLEDRGLTYKSRAQSTHLTPEMATSIPQLVPPETCRLVIVVDELSNPVEKDMVTRIAGALGLDLQSFQIVDQGTAFDLAVSRFRHLLALGPGGAMMLAKAGLHDIALNELRRLPPDGHVLLIPHPRAMLAQPQLKVSAWQALQRFRETLV